MSRGVFRALAVAFGAIGRLRFWPGDVVRVYGREFEYVRLIESGFHVVALDGVEQVAPPDSVKSRSS